MTVYPEYKLQVDLMFDKNQHNYASNILACQIDDSLSYRRLWNGINGDRIWAYYLDFYLLYSKNFLIDLCQPYVEFQLFIWLQEQQNSI